MDEVCLLYISRVCLYLSIFNEKSLDKLWAKVGKGWTKFGLGGVQSLDLGIQCLDRPCTLVDVIGQSMYLRVHNQDRFCTFARRTKHGQTLDKGWTKSRQILSLG